MKNTHSLHHKITWREALAIGSRRVWSKYRYGILLLCLFAGLLVFMRWALPVVIQPRLSAFFAIENIQVAGKLEFASSLAIQDVIQDHIQDTALYEIDVERLQADLIAVPWVESAQIKRVWPHELHLTLEETVPIAVWNETQILSNRGDLFEPQNVDAHSNLPNLLGTTSQVDLITDMYRQSSKVLRQASLKLVELEYQDGLVWQLRVEDNTRAELQFTLVLDGEKSVSRLYRFIEHYPSLSRMEERPERIDLRYPTGMAVSWHEEKS